MLSVVALLAIVAFAPMSPSAMLDSPSRHVRAMHPHIQQLLREGFQRSPTFARLIERIEASDVIVHIEMPPQLPAGVEGRMLMLPRAHDNRYVRIQIGNGGTTEDMIALLGHELQHVAEVAAAPYVSNAGDLLAFYERIGKRSGWHQYDTAEAQEAGRQVRKELA